MKAISFKNHKGETLRGFVHKPKKYDTAVIHLHGFPGSMANTSRKVCTSLAKKGYLCMRFEFSGSNTSGGTFEDKTMSKEVREVKYAIDFLSKNYKFKKLVLSGISTGAIDAALYAHKDKRVSKIVLISGVSKLDEGVRYDFSDRQVRDFWTKGYTTYSRPGYWVHKKKLKKKFYDEFFTLSIEKSLKKYRRPTLIIHGTEDEAVPCTKDPHELYQMANKPKKLVIVKGADHRFLKPKHFRELIKHVDRFIRAKKL